MKCKISRLTILGVCLAEAWPEPYQEQEQKQQPLHRHCAAPSRIGSAQIKVSPDHSQLRWPSLEKPMHEVVNGRASSYQMVPPPFLRLEPGKENNL